MKRSIKSFRAGTTLVETMMAVGCGSLVLAAVLLAGVALQRSFAAVEGYSMAQGDQLRVQDYLAMDCRRCTVATVDATTHVLTLTLPNYYDGSGNPVAPVYQQTYDDYGNLLNTKITYAPGAPTTIKYYQSGSNFVRQVNINGVAGAEKAIASNVSSFKVRPQDLTTTLSCSITFKPIFTRLPGQGQVAGTTVYSNTFLRNAVARMPDP
jgi:hypothetical protein